MEQNKEKRKACTFHLTNDLHKILKQRALDCDTTLTRILEQILEDHFGLNQKTKLY